MKRRIFIMAGLATCMLFLAGCPANNDIPGDGTGLEGEWTGSLDALIAAANLNLPIAISPDAQVIFGDDGKITISVHPDIPIVGGLATVTVTGTFVKDLTTAIPKVNLTLNNASANVIGIDFNIQSFSVSTQCIYTIQNQNKLYMYPGFNLLPAALRAQFEAAPGTIPWQGTHVTVNGVDTAVPSLQLDRVTS